MTRRGFAADFVFTALPDEPLLRGGAVVLDGESRVVAVGPAAELRRAHAEAHWSDVPGLLMPGLVNAHVHLELSALRGHTRSGGGFAPWARSMLEARDRLAPERDAEALEAAVSELLRFGTAAIGEITNSLAAVDPLRTAPLLGRVFHEVFGPTREAARRMWELARTQRQGVAPWPASLSHAPAPHTLYSLHPDAVREVVAEAREMGQRTSLHLAEHPAERAFLRDGTGPFPELLAQRQAELPDWEPPCCDPVRYALQLGVLREDVLCVHLADAREDEIAEVARAGAPVVLCPRSNLFIELKLPPLNLLLDAGIEPGLGSDSLASNTTLDVLAEASALHDRFPAVPASRLLCMATRFGARALGLDHRLGALAPGLAPGLLQLACPGDAPDPAAHVLRYHREARSVLCRPALPTDDHPLEAAP